MATLNLTLAFDIGHSSIGWAVFNKNSAEERDFPHLLGAGTVLFPKDGCLAASRRNFRRSRRNIAARRSRIARLKNYLETTGVLTREQLCENGNSFPWFLAARVLKSEGREKLSWSELWGVLRWYAHNRGYDGNALWAGDFIDPQDDDSPGDDEDSKKVKNARALMEEYGTNRMAETICAVLDVDPLGDKKSSQIYFKGKNAAFPRDVVEREVRKILDFHKNVLPKIDDTLIEILTRSVPAEMREALSLPARFSERGGLLFGQYVPRFDNRIIGKCRITGKNVPLKSCREYLLYRWGRLLNNLTVFSEFAKNDVRTLKPSERKQLHEKMLQNGYFNKKTLNAALKEITRCEPANTESYFLIEEMEEALVLDPVKEHVETGKRGTLWEHFSEHGKKIFAAELAKGKTLPLSQCVERMKAWGDWETEAEFNAALASAEQAETKKTSKKGKKISNLRFSVKFPTGRASYCREILKKTFDEALAGTDSTQPGGCLYETEEIRKRLLQEPLEKQTNNHLVRHRLTIFERLIRDIIEEYADGNAKCVKDVVVEVVKDLKEFSGLTSQEIARKMNEAFGNFRTVSKKLELDAQKAGVPVTASLIRKARLLEDQNFICPYTGQKLSYNELFGNALEIEHIIPRALRPSDALNSCIMTFSAVNKMKGERTAMQFIKDCGGQPVAGMENISILPPKAYEDLAEKHKGRYGFPKSENGRKKATPDQARCRKRSELLLLEKYDQRNADFTDRDLTQTSYLNKMAIRLVQQKFGIAARHLAGAVTGFVRKNMNIDECLIAAVPRMQEAARSRKDVSQKLLKSDMRGLSHLHHAMDAVTQGLTGLMFRTEDWKLLVKRRLTQPEREMLRKKYPNLLTFSSDGKISINPLCDAQRKDIQERLAECRVVRHIPAKMHGIVVDQTTWGIVGSDEKSGKVKITQKTTDEKKGRCDDDGKRLVKFDEKKPSMLLGYDVPAGTKSKLQAIKGVVQISENWGCSLDPVPTVIPYFKVFPRLRELNEKNNGKPIRILKNGMLIEVLSGDYAGVWEIRSIKNKAQGIYLAISAPDKDKIEEKQKNVPLKSLLKFGLKILKPRLTGLSCPTTSSQSKAKQPS